MQYRKFYGSLLAALMLFAALMAVLGIWGLIGRDAAWQLFASFVVVAMAVMGLSYVTDSFFGKPKEEASADKPKT